MKKYTPLEYIKIDIANQYGLDKEPFEQRIAWVDSQKDLRSKMHAAEKPAQYIVAVMALEDALAGRPSGHLVGLDACASGIAILGLLTGCHVTAKNTGIIGNERMDMYTECTKAINDLLDNNVVIPRSDVKSAQMTFFYGSKANPRKLFGEDSVELMAFYAAQEQVAPGACMMMREFLSSWRPFALEHGHTLPDNFHSIVPVLQKMKTKIEIDELQHQTLTYIFEDNANCDINPEIGCVFLLIVLSGSVLNLGDLTSDDGISTSRSGDLQRIILCDDLNEIVCDLLIDTELR